MSNKNYYQAYQKRYEQVHRENMLWESRLFTPDIIKCINHYKIQRNNKILDLGCGEGRDTIHLLEQGYDVLGIDYSIEAINISNKLSNNKYQNKFRQFDIMEDKLDSKFKFIYSVAVFHMFLLQEHRDKFLKFIKEHLLNDGYCLLSMMGDGEKTYTSNIDDAFKNAERVVNNKKINVATTSCRIVDWKTLEEEISRNGLIIKKKWISKDTPGFTKMMDVVIRKVGNNYE